MRKVFIGIASLLFIFIASAIIIPIFFKKDIIALAYNEVEKKIDAKTNIEDINLSILKNIRNFPNIALSFEDVTLVGKNEFDGDTLLNLGNLKASLDIMSVIKGEEYKIEAIELHDVYLNAIVNKDGLQNWNIIKPSEETDNTPSKFKLALNKLLLDKVNVFYDDLQNGNVFKAENISHKGKGDFSSEVFDYISNTEIEKVYARQKLITYLKNANLTFKSKVNIDQTAQKYSFKDNKLTLNDLGLIFDGFVQTQTESTKLDVNFKADQTTFKSILSLIPAIYSKDFKDLKSSGSLDLNGKINGILQGENYPNFNVNLKIDNGQFQYPSLPTAVNNVFVQANIQHAQGNLDKTIIDISKLDFKMGTEPIVAKLKIATPISNPDVDLLAKGKLNLANIAKIYPLEGVDKLSGSANVDLNVKAKKSDIDAKNYAAIFAAGNIIANNIEYASKDVPKPVSVSNLLLKFSPQYVALEQCKASIANSDFDITGNLENFIGYFLSKDAILSGKLNVLSNKIDANAFLPDSTSAKQSKSQQAKEVVRIPKNVDFTATTQIGTLLYDQLTLKNLQGSTNIKEEQLNLNNLSANLLGGSAIISGYYNTKTDIPTAKLNYNITNFNIQEVYKFVNTAKQAAPIMEHIEGNFNSNMNITSTLTPDLSPVLNSINGTANFKMPWANISGVNTINKIIEVTKLKQLENIRLENINIFTTVANGRILIEPFNVKANNIDMTIGGSQGLDQTLDYAIAIDVPWQELNQEAGNFAKNLLAKNPIPQLNNAIPEVVRINLKVTGTSKNPKITVGKPDGKIGNGTMKDAVKEQVQEQIQNLKEEALQIKDELKEQGKQTFDTLKTQAKEQAKQTISNIISGNKNDSTNTTQPIDNIKKTGEDLKEKLKGKLPWQR
jgi:hypothetical protein